MADVVSERPAPLARPRPEPVVSRRKFGLAYLALAAIVGAAVGLIVVLATRGGGHSKPVAWSSWAPTQLEGTLRAREIAAHVSSEYRLANGRQLAGVLAGPMQLPQVGGPIPVSALLVSSGTAGVTAERIDVAFPNAGVFFQIAGPAAAGQLAGAPTAEKSALMFREVLELALYTFHYDPQADHIVAFLPPQPGVLEQNPAYQRAIYLPRQALREELAAPLGQTLDPEAKITPTALTSKEATKVAGILAGHLYHFDYQQLTNQTLLLQLSPIQPYG